MFCGKCGNEMKEGEKFCGKCGAPVSTKEKGNVTQKILHNTKEVISEVVTNRENIKRRIKNNKKIVIIIVAIFLVIVVGHNKQNNHNDNKTISTSKTSSSDVSSTSSTKSNKVSSIVEKSNISYTGMRFKKDWTEFKKEIDNYYDKKYGEAGNGEIGKLKSFVISDWQTEPFGNDYNIYSVIKYRYGYGTKNVLNKYALYSMNVTVEKNSNKIISITLVSDTLKDQDNKNQIEDLTIYLGALAPEIASKLSEIDESNLEYYEDNICMYFNSANDCMILVVCASDKNEYDYFKENGRWEKLKEN